MIPSARRCRVAGRFLFFSFPALPHRSMARVPACSVSPRSSCLRTITHGSFRRRREGRAGVRRFACPAGGGGRLGETPARQPASGGGVVALSDVSAGRCPRRRRSAAQPSFDLGSVCLRPRSGWNGRAEGKGGRKSRYAGTRKRLHPEYPVDSSLQLLCEPCSGGTGVRALWSHRLIGKCG